MFSVSKFFIFKGRRLAFGVTVSLMLLALAITACGSSEPEPAPIEPAVTVETVIVVATPTAEVVADSAADTNTETETESSTPSEATEDTGTSTSSNESSESQTSGSSATSSTTTAAESSSSGNTEPTVTALVDLNVRSGPGTNYDVVSAMSAGSSAAIMGKSNDGHWWKIACPAGATGSECWTSAGAQFSSSVHAEGVAVAAAPPAPVHNEPTATVDVHNEPTPTIVAVTQEPTAVYTATPTEEAVEPTPTEEVVEEPTATYTPTPTEEAVQEAPFDNDSLQNPAQDLFLSITGNRSFSHQNAVSYSGGDQDDWVAFEFPNNSNTAQSVWVTLNCDLSGNVGNAQLRATVWENGTRTNKVVLCNEGEQRLTVDNTAKQTIQIHFGVTNEGVYATYELIVVGFK